MSESESCPFCRSLDNSVQRFGSGKAQMFHVNCHNCGADGPIADTSAEAERLWKTRPPEPQRGNGHPHSKN
ncbi:MAG: hypothetical protein EOS58_31695 [Mesorhizobium sp.]|nr:MAG: hypothetical protein EOS58_31695 [Mesorhizobium sp.]TIW22946.1 MAG: hypothetical protein E5V63_25855 [Mesorhizobium sp.]